MRRIVMAYNSRTATFSVEEYSFICNVGYRRDQYSGPVACILELRESPAHEVTVWQLETSQITRIS
jgi:hypothetical protein